ncbi:LytTR family DNA-binding domain-containing protein [Pendulispora brunnea]|uniref:LytTR family DNA-binding domain-containing protein n=1 Tax=Pendulispora brunnea TaxID=2905690 RepID=A0ABZ2K734_9BACT
MRPEEKLRVVVLEDEWVARNFLVEMIEATGIASVIGAMETFDEAVAFMSKAPSSIDVVFVDINLVGSAHNGLELIQQFVKRPGAPAFVLATALREHALEAFEMGVVDYVLKPFDERRVLKCLEKLHAARRNSAYASEPSRPLRIIARNKRNLVFLTLGEVWAVEASEGMTQVHSGRGTFDIDISLDTIATSFGREFLRVHRNWLVSEEHVLELERDSGESALLVGSRTPGGSSLRVPIARDRLSSLRARLMHEGVGMRRR